MMLLPGNNKVVNQDSGDAHAFRVKRGTCGNIRNFSDDNAATVLGSLRQRQAFEESTFEVLGEIAVLVGAREGYYGECKFQIDLSAPLYVKMDHNSLKGLFGKFNPSRGDLVFSRTGELLGVMANSTYCMMIKNFNPTATFQFAQDVRDQQTGETLARLYTLIAALPSKLQ